MKILLFAVLILIAVVPVAIWLDIRHEVNEFNGGRCPCCDGRLEFYREDEEDGRVYICERCKYSVNVTYTQVDKDYVEE